MNKKVHRYTTNRRVREAVYSLGLPFWQVSLALGMGETTLTSKLRVELPEEEQDELVNKIKNISPKDIPIMNSDIRNAIDAAGITQTSVAIYIGADPAVFNARLLRRKLEADERQNIFKAIDALAEKPVIFTNEYQAGYKDGYKKCLDDMMGVLTVEKMEMEEKND